MTINGLISLLNILIAAGLIAIGVGLMWRARGRFLEWPVGARIALGGVFLAAGICWGQLSVFRHTTPPDVVGPNGAGTLVLRGLCAVLVLALTWRVFAGSLLTAHDRDGGNG